MRLSLLAAALAAPLTASAQGTPADVWPLAPGNTWTYIAGSSEYSNSGYYSSDPARIVTWTVLDSVETASGRLPRVRLDGGDCLVESAQAGDATTFRLLALTGDAPCATYAVPTFGGPDFSVYPSSGPATVVVGGESVTVPRTRGGYQDDGAYSSVFLRTADGLGVTGVDGSYHTGGSGFYRSEGMSLRHAVIGGQAVGQTLETRADFWPLAVGNRWEFRLTDAAGASAGEVAWTVEAAGSGVALRMQHVRDGAVVSSVTCPVAVGAASPATTWQTPFSLTSCTLPDPTLAPNLNGAFPSLSIDVYAAAQPVAVGAQTVTADVAYGGGQLGGGPNGAVAERTYRLARAVGPVSYTSYNQLGTYYRWNATLAFARVGTASYGQQVVAGEASPSAVALSLAAGPNPARGAVALTFALPAAAAATAEVLDALGRSVLRADLGAQAAGAGAARLDVSGLAPGVYVVRLAAGPARASTRISVVR